MTNRERIVGTLLGRQTDRAPFGLGIGWEPWQSTLERWRQESGVGDLAVSRHFGYDTPFAVVPLEFGPEPNFEQKVLSEDDEFVVRTDWRGLTVRSRRDGGSMPEFLDYPVKSVSDWERYKNERLQPKIGQRTRAVDGFLRSMEGVDAPVQLGFFPWGVFGSPRDLVGAEELLVGFYTEPEMVRDMMETFTDLWLGIYGAALEKVAADHIHIWEDMSGRQGSLLSPAMIEEFMMPCYDRIHAFARQHNIPLVSVDSDGLVDELVPLMMKHGVNMFFPFEVQAGNDVREYRRRYPGLGIMGGLDKNALADNAPRGALHRELDRAEQMLAAGGYVPGFDHLIPPNVSWATWELAVGELRKLIGA